MDLMDFVRDAMFEAVVRQLFGHDNVPQEKVCVWVIVLRAAGLRAYCIRICTVNKINLVCFNFNYSLVPRPFHVFNVSHEQTWKAWV